MTGYPSDMAPAPVWGRPELVCPAAWGVIRRMIRAAKANPWRGDVPITHNRHNLDTTAILEPGRPLRIMFTLDYGYHQSGWFANSDYERCFHLSLSLPRPDRLRVYRHQPAVGAAGRVGIDLETPSDDEARAWGRVFFGEHHPKSWFEPAVGPLDPYRSPGVVHLRLYLDQAGNVIQPRGEVYDLLPFADGSSPAKVMQGRFGGDTR